jgi:hypothetical protein
MNIMRSFLLTFAALGLFTVAGHAANIVTINLDSSSLTVVTGTTVTFHGTLTDTGPSTVDLLSGSISLPGPFTDDGGSLFFNNAPFTLDPGAPSDGFDMFSITVSPTFSGPFGLQPSGTFSVTGTVEGSADQSEIILGQTNFQITVLSPEPGTFVLLGLALSAGVALRRRLVR